MRYLKVEVFDEENSLIKKFIAMHLDATSKMTILYTSEPGSQDKKPFIERFPFEIDHWNIFAGMITIYYKCGCYMEVSHCQHK